MAQENGTRQKLDRLGDEFMLGWLRTETARHPNNTEALAELATILTRHGYYEEGLAIDLRLVAMRPEDPIARYNLACSFALLTRNEEALEALHLSVKLGYCDKDFILQDSDLKQLQIDPRFEKILREMELMKGAS